MSVLATPPGISFDIQNFIFAVLSFARVVVISTVRQASFLPPTSISSSPSRSTLNLPAGCLALNSFLVAGITTSRSPIFVLPDSSRIALSSEISSNFTVISVSTFWPPCSLSVLVFTQEPGLQFHQYLKPGFSFSSALS